MDEDVVEGGVLDAQGSQRLVKRGGQFHKLHRRLRPGGGQNAIEAGRLGLDTGNAVEALQALLPFGGFAVEMDLDGRLGAGDAALSSRGVPRATKFPWSTMAMRSQSLFGLFHVMGGDEHGEMTRLPQVV